MPKELYDQVQSQDERIQTLEENPVNNDVNYDTMNNLTRYMRGTFWEYGQYTFPAGLSGTLVISGVNSSSIVFITPPDATTRYGATCSTDLVTFYSATSSNQTINYFIIINP